MQDLQRQLEHIQRNAEADSARVRSRTDAEIADLKARIASLEADLEKVCKPARPLLETSDPNEGEQKSHARSQDSPP